MNLTISDVEPFRDRVPKLQPKTLYLKVSTLQLNPNTEVLVLQRQIIHLHANSERGLCLPTPAHVPQDHHQCPRSYIHQGLHTTEKFPAKVLRLDWICVGHTPSSKPVPVEEEVRCSDLLFLIHLLTSLPCVDSSWEPHRLKEGARRRLAPCWEGNQHITTA